MKELSSGRFNDRLPSPTTHSAPRRMLKNFSSSVYDRLNALTGILSKTINGWRHKNYDDEDPSNNGHRMTDVHKDESCHYKFLFLCISQWKRYYMTKMVPINLKVNSDDALFQLLRMNFNLMIGPWRRFLSLRYVSDIRFVQFHTTKNSIITIKLHFRVSGQIPPGTHPDYLPPHPYPEYFYKPAPITMEPPVGHNTMLHRYRCPKECGGLDFCLKRFPKHINGEVTIEDSKDETTAWGIELVEGRDWAYLWFIGLLTILCAMIFGVVWARVMKDVSGGFIVAGYVVAAFACLVGTIQVSLETL
ncbi:hypothetical protein K432DRAFT_382736 [Lepidopterella palustris CBS 459.81]|uniref:Uncharacterized protein n=1 Tax=Lepidopterella palustris CBS 459.81 TaxID=1314670 RepID=A0A8E2E9V2_9PEZI|nr:hypothetical protein K432DRAFT_382736 [Lepidopterella palustris CBS 459.81]